MKPRCIEKTEMETIAMPEPLVSIIVPAYNAAGCIARCVESIVSQSYQELEILLLNDGSRDDTLAICRKLAEADPRIRVIDKLNTGAADTRSCGLALARGEYIQFADSDDYLLPGCTANLVAAARRSRADLVLAPYRMMVPRRDGGYDTREYSLLPAGEYSKVDYLWQLTGHAAAFYYGVLWNKLYRRDLIRMAQIRFENVVFAEDQLFNTRYLQAAQRFAAIDEAVYCYIQNPQSVCHTQVRVADMLRHRDRMYRAYRQMCIQLGVYDRFRLRLRRNRFELRRGDRDLVHQRVHLEMGMELQRVVVRRFGNIQPEGHEFRLADVFQRDHSGVGEAVAGGERPGEHQQVRGRILLLFQHLDPERDPVAFPGFQDSLRQAPCRVPLAAALPGVDLQRAGAGERSCGIEFRITAVVPSAAEVLLKVEHRSGGGDAQRQSGCRDKLNFHADSPCSTTG